MKNTKCVMREDFGDGTYSALHPCIPLVLLNLDLSLDLSKTYLRLIKKSLEFVYVDLLQGKCVMSVREFKKCRLAKD